MKTGLTKGEKRKHFSRQNSYSFKRRRNNIFIHSVRCPNDKILCKTIHLMVAHKFDVNYKSTKKKKYNNNNHKRNELNITEQPEQNICGTSRRQYRVKTK